jgi:hypothetical protein
MTHSPNAELQGAELHFALVNRQLAHDSLTKCCEELSDILHIQCASQSPHGDMDLNIAECACSQHDPLHQPLAGCQLLENNVLLAQTSSGRSGTE